jgi:hypothetical protein
MATAADLQIIFKRFKYAFILGNGRLLGLLALIIGISAWATIAYWGRLGALFVFFYLFLSFANLLRFANKPSRALEIDQAMADKVHDDIKVGKASKGTVTRTGPSNRANRGKEPVGDDSSKWGTIIGNIASLLAFLGIIVYGFLAFSYEHFYQSLGIDPSDVGLTYSSVLSRASGFVAALVIAVLLFYAVPIWVFRGDPDFRSNSVENMRLWRLAKKRLAFHVLIYVVIVILVPAPLSASRLARRVKEGKAVAPYQTIVPAPLTLLYLRADPVIIEAIDGSTSSPALGRLTTCAANESCKLLYLGQANGIAVIYDAVGQESIFLPISEVGIRVKNCSDSPVDQCQ